MAESLKIIHVCDHVTKEILKEDKSVQLLRQETREDETLRADDNRFVYTGEWSTLDVNANDGIQFSSSIGSIATIHFYGDNICIYTRKIPDGGKVKITLDGVEVGVVDLYSPTLLKKETLLFVDRLIYGMHTVKVEIISEKNSSSTGNVVVIESALIYDAFIIDNSPYEVISGGDIVESINLVYQDVDGDVAVYTKGVDYIPLGSNKIRWISVNRPNPDYKYTIEYTRRFTKSTTHASAVCPRCYGLGWYGSFNNLTDSMPYKSLGVYKIAEDIIKIMLTPLREDGYGSEFLEINKHLYVSESSVEDLATSEINRIERYYKSTQASEIAMGALYTPEDTLYAIIIDEASFDTAKQSLNIVITVYNNVGRSHQSKINI